MTTKVMSISDFLAERNNPNKQKKSNSTEKENENDQILKQKIKNKKNSNEKVNPLNQRDNNNNHKPKGSIKSKTQNENDNNNNDNEDNKSNYKEPKVESKGGAKSKKSLKEKENENKNSKRRLEFDEENERKKFELKEKEEKVLSERKKQKKNSPENENFDFTEQSNFFNVKPNKTITPIKNDHKLTNNPISYNDMNNSNKLNNNELKLCDNEKMRNDCDEILNFLNNSESELSHHDKISHEKDLLIKMWQDKYQALTQTVKHQQDQLIQQASKIELYNSSNIHQQLAASNALLSSTQKELSSVKVLAESLSSANTNLNELERKCKLLEKKVYSLQQSHDEQFQTITNLKSQLTEFEKLKEEATSQKVEIDAYRVLTCTQIRAIDGNSVKCKSQNYLNGHSVLFNLELNEENILYEPIKINSLPANQIYTEYPINKSASISIEDFGSFGNKLSNFLFQKVDEEGNEELED